ncbi:hypothetical protein ONZ45_g9794 [Pleurotus djamor]|nr:hypothetical protein ONZ45_g9794 [Pleurotus djamor]
MASDSSALPIDLLAIILNEVAIPKPVALFPMLFVCRRFHDITIRILYRDISIEMSVEAKSEKMRRILSLKASSHLSLTLRFALTCHNLPWYMPRSGILEHIVRSMRSLQKLCLILGSAGPTLLASISSTTLTHLTFSASLFSGKICDALMAQPSIQYLKLTACPGGSQLPMDALPTLRSIVINSGLWNRFATGRPVQHLHDAYLYDSRMLHSLDFLSSLLSLKLSVENVKCLRELVPHLKNVEYLCLTIRDYGLGIQVDQSFTIDNYLAVPSQNLQYCNVGSLSLSSTDVKQMFDKFPQLKALDSKTPSDRHPFTVERYVRDAECSVMKGFPALRQWEHWWENVCRDLD